MAKGFYEDSTRSEGGPKFTEVLTFADGETAEFEFVLFRLDPNAVESFDATARQVAEEARKEVSEEELRRFSSAVIQKHREAASAALEYRAAADLKLREQRLTIMKGAALFLIPPPLVLLILGYGIAWVRRGFRTAT